MPSSFSFLISSNENPLGGISSERPQTQKNNINPNNRQPDTTPIRTISRLEYLVPEMKASEGKNEIEACWPIVITETQSGRL